MVMSKLAIRKTTDAALAVSAMSDDELRNAMCSAVLIGEITDGMRTLGNRVVQHHQIMNLAFEDASRPLRDADFAEMISERLPAATDLKALARFASLASLEEAPRSEVNALISLMAEALGSSRTSGSAIALTLRALVNHEDTATIYGHTLTGFSVPILQTTVDVVASELGWFPRPNEALEKALRVRRAFNRTKFAAKQQLMLRLSADRYFGSTPTDADLDVPFS